MNTSTYSRDEVQSRIEFRPNSHLEVNEWGFVVSKLNSRDPRDSPSRGVAIRSLLSRLQALAMTCISGFAQVCFVGIYVSS